jgi:hypothetical protein
MIARCAASDGVCPLLPMCVYPSRLAPLAAQRAMMSAGSSGTEDRHGKEGRIEPCRDRGGVLILIDQARIYTEPHRPGRVRYGG